MIAVDCHDCAQVGIAVTRAKGDLIRVARRAARKGDPSPALLAEIAAAKAEVARRLRNLDEHMAAEHDRT